MPADHCTGSGTAGSRPMQETAMLSKVKIADTDLMVSRLCYGTNMLGTAIDQAGANAILDHFAELGGT